MTEDLMNEVPEQVDEGLSGQEIPAEVVDDEAVKMVEDIAPVVEEPAIKKEISGSPLKRKERPDLLTLIAIYHFLMALPGLFFGCLLVALPVPAILTSGAEGIGLFAALVGMAVAIFFTGGFGVFSAVVGWGLLKMKGWARWSAITLAILGLLAVPVGTLIGGLLLIYFFQDEIKALFE
jgi:hypothetical protein